MFRFNSVGLLLYLMLLSGLSFFFLILGLKIGVALYFYVTLVYLNLTLWMLFFYLLEAPRGPAAY